MLLDRIGEEFKELTEIIKFDEYMKDCKMFQDTIDRYSNPGVGMLLSWSRDMRDLSVIEINLKSKKFTSKIVQYYVDRYIMYVEKIFFEYDGLSRENKDASTYDLKYAIYLLYDILKEINIANELIPKLYKETWEELPSGEETANVNNIVISSESRSMSLSDVSSDVGNLDKFFNNISLLINQGENKNIYLRKVETGSLTVIVSCMMEAAPIIAFMFWFVKQYQKSEKRHLENEEKRLKLINDSMDTAKEILKVDPDNKEATEIIQKCAIHILDFLDNNPKGTINGTSYDIGMDKLKIEEKDKDNNENI